MAIAMKYKSFTLSCNHCGITENMIFFRQPMSLGYRCRIDSEQVFKAKRDLLGDRAPRFCPLCSGRLTQEPGPMIRS